MNTKTRAVAISSICTLALTGWAASTTTSASADQGTSAQHVAAKPKPPAPHSLDILLTNDDGWNKPGITAAYEALTAAGHHVTLVAPSTNQSGMSAAMPDAALHVEQSPTDPNVYNVNSTPANSMDVGVLAILDEKPDLVVSGINKGANAGGFIALSGTVGATVAARALYGIPGIAISLEKESDDPADYRDAARLLVDIVSHGTDYIDDGTILNVNYPDLDPGRSAPTGVVYAEPSNAVPYTWDYTLEEDGDVGFDYALTQPPATGDMAELARDKVTLSLIRTTAGGLGVPANQAPKARKLATDLG